MNIKTERKAIQMHLQFTLWFKVKGITIENEYKTPITRHGKAMERHKNKQNDDDFKKWKRKEKKIQMNL